MKVKILLSKNRFSDFIQRFFEYKGERVSKGIAEETAVAMASKYHKLTAENALAIVGILKNNGFTFGDWSEHSTAEFMFDYACYHFIEP